MYNKILEIITDIGYGVENLTIDSLFRDIGFDSLDSVGFILTLEHKFDVDLCEDFPYEDSSLDYLIKYIKSLQSDKI